jgi:uncharacterized membrane protein YdbT with pleckstrin-like domain
MAYIDSLLGRNEEVLYVGRQHWFTLFSNVLAELGLIALLIAAAVFAQQASGAPREALPGMGMTFGDVVFLICAVISIIVLCSALFDFLRWNSRQYVITAHRVLQVEGVLNKQVSDSSLEKINDLELRQSLIGRIFDYGDIEILTGSDVGVNFLRQIASPIEFKRQLLEAKQNMNRGFGYLDPKAVEAYSRPREAGQALSMEEIQQRLVKLVNLHEQGLISKEEFDAKKRELLSRI